MVALLACLFALSVNSTIQMLDTPVRKWTYTGGDLHALFLDSRVYCLGAAEGKQDGLRESFYIVHP